ncbi:histidine phosphatase family protein [Radiobacillus deserti]|uniref:Histidine phosphatase family protein n=1 Tax=Radiobacillus deserti TaxID=2594883 RepID=A0A516KFV1_9BACI|nr:histidine phosphatase family protein [Radiobacillus deserti]QDP40267.1 histidine phosphatase family protein [Radiobacillus deserti]
MNTIVYMLRHGDSPIDGNERTRVLSEKGIDDSKKVTSILKNEDIDVVISSPYTRAILTVQPLAKVIGQEVKIYEGLKERIFSNGETRLADEELIPLLEKSFSDPKFALKSAESNYDCQERAIRVLKEVLKTYHGKKVAVGTHGTVMTLIMGYFNEKYDLAFLYNTTKPDIYRMQFRGVGLIGVDRVWN